MKNAFILLLLLLTVATCKKTEFSPEGPTDIRVRNLSDMTFSEVIVNTSVMADTLGLIGPGAVSDYFRFEKAYPKAEISAKINGLVYTTGPVNTTYMHYIGQDRITYEVYISNLANRELKISNLVIEEKLVLE
jgi:hypothetical protein